MSGRPIVEASAGALGDWRRLVERELVPGRPLENVVAELVPRPGTGELDRVRIGVGSAGGSIIELELGVRFAFEKCRRPGSGRRVWRVVAVEELGGRVSGLRGSVRDPRGLSRAEAVPGGSGSVGSDSER